MTHLNYMNPKILVRFRIIGYIRILVMGQCVCTCVLSHICLCNPIDIACQAPPSMEFSRQEYWSGLPFPTPGDLPNSGIESTSLMFPSLPGGFFTTSTTWEGQVMEQYLSTSTV